MNKTPIQLAFLLVPLGTAACGGAAPGTQPHDMSSAEHQAAARQEEQTAEQHATQHDPSAEKTVEKCAPGQGTATGAFGPGTATQKVCWEEVTNPTEEHEKVAQEHRELAAKHRAASDALAKAEASACSGIPEDDRDISPFAHRADIRGVAKLDPKVSSASYVDVKSPEAGARITFRAVPGMTAQWLKTVVDCHIARNAALGNDVPEMDYCPLTLKGITATVTAVDNGFAVDVQSKDSATAEQIWQKAQKIAPTP